MSKIAVSDAAEYAKMLVSGIAGVGAQDGLGSVVEGIDKLAAAAPAGASFDLDESAEASYQAAKKAAQAAVDAAPDDGLPPGSP